MRRYLKIAGAGLVFAAALFGALAPSAMAGEGAVFLMYHRFGEESYPATNTRLEEFDQHLAELADGGYTVLPVPSMVAALRRGQALPERSIGLTIDDAYRSVYENAWPRLRQANFPFTLFVATQALDQGLPDFMTWDQLREMAADPRVTLANHSASHPHLPSLSNEAVRREVEQGRARLLDELGASPPLFAYPYGEESLALRAILAGAGITTAFGQHSGVAHRGSDFLNLPRFALNEAYGEIGRFRLVANALPLPVSEFTPQDSILSATQNPPAISFTVAPSLGRLDRLACYASDGGQTTLAYREDRRVDLRLQAALPRGRSRINCTLPGPKGRWRWFGRQFYLP